MLTVGMQIVYNLHSACKVIDMNVFMTVMLIICTDHVKGFSWQCIKNNLQIAAGVHGAECVLENCVSCYLFHICVR